MHHLPETDLSHLQHGNTNMLAEIFMVRLEMLMRVAANAAPPVSDKRFVPVTLPPEPK
jgi:hypothetical protein